MKQSLERTLCTPCPYCEGAGYVKSAADGGRRDPAGSAARSRRAVEGKDVMLRVASGSRQAAEVAIRTRYLQELEEILGRPVIVKSDPLLHQEKFDLA